MDKYYKILGLNKNASLTEVKKAYRRLAMKYHPDRNKEKDAEEKFKEIKEAYEIITNKNTNNNNFQKNEYDFEEEDDNFGFESVFSNFFKDIGINEEETEENIYIVDLSVEQAFKGLKYKKNIFLYKICKACNGGKKKKEIKRNSCFKCKGTGFYRKLNSFFNIKYICSFCNGTGKIIKNNCKLCEGKGKVLTKDEIKVNIPRGVSEGIRFKINNVRNLKNVNPIKYEDIYLEVHINNTNEYSLDSEDNLICKIGILFIDAIIGKIINLNILDKNIKLVLPECSKGGSVFFYKKKGYFSYRKNCITDLYIEIYLTYPEKINSLQKKELIKIRKLFI
ncbi:DnaJ domain-containing protein [Candidatus Vidania fulgoroideorum]